MANESSDNTQFIFLGFSGNDKVGFKVDEFTSNASYFVDCAISGEVFGSIIFSVTHLILVRVYI